MVASYFPRHAMAMACNGTSERLISRGMLRGHGVLCICVAAMPTIVERPARTRAHNPNRRNTTMGMPGTRAQPVRRERGRVSYIYIYISLACSFGLRDVRVRFIRPLAAVLVDLVSLGKCAAVSCL